MSSRPIRLAAAASIALLVGGLCPVHSQQAPPAAVDVESLGPKVGEKIPAFSLPDQYGATRTWQSLMGPKGAILVFFRSADW